VSIRVVRLGSERSPREGLRIGTVRRPPRGVPKERYAKDDWYDVWLPNLAPSQALVTQAQRAKTDKDWQKYMKRYRSEMARPESRRVLELLAALSHGTNLAVGCYCEDEKRCHRSVLRELLEDCGAEVV